MTSVDLVAIDHAAEALGVTTETLMRRLDGGGLPEAVHRNGTWNVPSGALADIAAREGWPLDLRSESDLERLSRVPEQLDRYINETMAAHAAVVLAKTQAAAARAEARDLAKRTRELAEDLEAERIETDRLQAILTASERAQAILERDKAVAEARSDEVRKQVEQERIERSLLAKRVGELEADREEAMASMGWWSRRRYDRRRPGLPGANQ